MRRIPVEGIPEPKGHYSPGVEHGGLIYVSGQLPMGYAVEATKLSGLKVEGSSR